MCTAVVRLGRIVRRFIFLAVWASGCSGGEAENAVPDGLFTVDPQEITVPQCHELLRIVTARFTFREDYHLWYFSFALEGVDPALKVTPDAGGPTIVNGEPDKGTYGFWEMRYEVTGIPTGTATFDISAQFRVQAGADPIREFPITVQVTTTPCEPSADLIVFSNIPKGGYSDIYTIDPATGAWTRLTDNGPVFDEDPAWSPDRSQIAFVSTLDDPQADLDLFVMNADGSGQERVTRVAAVGKSVDDPAWSPKGNEIAVALGVTGYETDIWILNVTDDPPSLRQLTFQPQNPLLYNFDTSPVWSDDGTEIMFVRNGSVYVVPVPAEGETPQIPQLLFAAEGGDRIFTIDSGPEGVVFEHELSPDTDRRLKKRDEGGGFAKVTAGGTHTADLMPSWSPTSDLVVFVRQAGEAGKRLHVVTVDELGPHEAEEIAGQPDGDSSDPDWGFPRQP